MKYILSQSVIDKIPSFHFQPCSDGKHSKVQSFAPKEFTVISNKGSAL